MTDQEARAWLEQLSREKGVPMEASDVADLARRSQGDIPAVQDAYRDQYARRAAPTMHREFDSQSGAYPDIGGDPRSEPGYGRERPRNLSALMSPAPRMLAGQQDWRTMPVRVGSLSSLLQTDPYGIQPANLEFFSRR